MLNPLRQLVLQQLQSGLTRTPGPRPQVFFAQQRQRLTTISITQACAIWVLEGQKWYSLGGIHQTLQAGEVLLLSPGDQLSLQNLPGPNGVYLALLVQWTPEQLHSATALAPDYCARGPQQAPRQLLASQAHYLALTQWLEAAQRHGDGGQGVQHDWRLRPLELLLQFLQAGTAGRFYLGAQKNWSQRVAALVSKAPGRPWRIAAVAAHFHQSEASLRRRLAAENTSFRQLLEHIRLQAALNFLTNTNWPLNQIAQEVGYESAARFSARFLLMYGLRPNQYRATQQPR